MKPHPSHHVVPLAFVLAVMIIGCSGDDPTEPSGGLAPTFDNIWPAALGDYWTYDLEERRYSVDVASYERLEDVPPLPTMEELYAELQLDGPGTLLRTDEGTLRWQIMADATVTPDSTVLSVSRQIEATVGYPSPPYGLRMGPIWTRSGNSIASYYESGASKWLHLEGSLESGYSFVSTPFGLVRASLTTSVWRIRPFSVAGREYPRCVECFYVLDLGISTDSDEGGNITGYWRSYEYGVIVYAPEIGPVYCRAKFLEAESGVGGLIRQLHVRVGTLLEHGRSD